MVNINLHSTASGGEKSLPSSSLLTQTLLSNKTAGWRTEDHDTCPRQWSERLLLHMQASKQMCIWAHTNDSTSSQSEVWEYVRSIYVPPDKRQVRIKEELISCLYCFISSTMVSTHCCCCLAENEHLHLSYVWQIIALAHVCQNKLLEFYYTCWKTFTFIEFVSVAWIKFYSLQWQKWLLDKEDYS